MRFLSALPGRVLILALVVPLTIVLHLAYAGSRVTLSLFALSLQASPFTVGVLLSLLALLPMTFSVTVGRLIDRIGVRGPMLVGATLLFAGIMVAVIWPTLPALFVTSCLIGSGFILFHIAVNYLAAVVGRPEDRAKNFSWLALGFSTSGFLGPMIAGFAIDWIGHRRTMLLLACFALITLIALLIKRIDTPRQPADEPGAKQRRLVDLLRSKTMRRVFIMSGLLSMVWDLFSFVVPIHGSGIGLSASTIGLILGAFGGAVFVVRLALPLVIHRLGEWQMLIAAMISTGIALFIFPLVKTVPVLIALAFFLGAGLGGAQPMIMSLLYSKAPPGRGAEAIGVRTFLINVSQTAIPLLFGALGAALGMTPVFWTMAALLVGGGYSLRKP
jgi:predicted MFS family arabinose efflux permease